MKHEILTLIGKNCITPGDGQKVYDLVHPELLALRQVIQEREGKHRQTQQ